MTAGMGSMSGESIRGYVRTLRQKRGVSQPKLAVAIGMALRTYKDWETGNTKSIDALYLIKIVRQLRGNLGILGGLADDGASYDDGAALAEDDDITQAELSALDRLNPAQRRLILELIAQFEDGA